MSAVKQRAGAVAWAVVALIGVPALFYLYVDATYRYALARGRLPLAVFPVWLWYFVLACCLVVGLFSLRKGVRLRSVIVSVIYLLGMCGVLLLVHLSVACGNGDCL
jgi:hypothetical protein